MRSKYYLGLVAAGLSLAGLAACGDDSNQGAGGTGGTPTTTSTGTPTTGTSTMSGSPTSTSGTGGSKDDGNNSFETAEDATLGMQVTAQLDPPDTDEDFFKFMGKAGQRIVVQTDAKPDNDPYADGYADLVITLFDDAKNQLAENDDPIPRNTQDSSLFTVLPKDGLYYLRVTEFCHWSAAINQPPQDCPATAPPVTIFDYSFQIDEMTSMLFPSLSVEAAEPNDTAATASPTVYAPNSNADYWVPVMTGKFDADTDVDVYAVKVPPDATPVAPEENETLRFDVFPNGETGNGSTAATGNVWITTAADSTAKLAQIDATKLDKTFGMTLSPPLAFGTDYLLFVQHASGEVAGANPFYFVLHSWGGGNPKETADLTNNVVATPEALTAAQLTGGTTGYFIAGKIDTVADVDHYTFDNDGSGPKMFVTCGGQRIGSGLRGLKATLFKADGITPIDNATETADADLEIGAMGSLDTPTDAKFVVKIEATMANDATIAGTYYQCGMGFTAQ